MSDTVIQVQELSKHYRLGQIGGGTVREDLERWWGRVRGRPDGPGSIRAVSDRAGERRDLWALRDVSFEVRRGEILGIIGRNGAGKSTLLKLLSRITAPTSGIIRIKGRVGSLLEVGTGFHPELTGRDNIYLNGAILGMKKALIDRRLEEIVEFSGVARHIDTPVKRYSSGMYVRLAFAVAAHLEPEILVIDEVLAVGDAQFQKKCLGKMGEVAKGGRTVLFVSHNMAAVHALCGRALLLEDGAKVFDGATAAAIQRYLASIRTEAGAELSAAHDRTGRGRVRYTRIRLENTRGEPIEACISGSPVVIALDYRSQGSAPLRHVRASVHVTDAVGQTLMLLSSELTRTDELVCPPCGTIRCTVPALPLSGSDYYLAPFLEVAGEVEDDVRSAVLLRVEDGDFYGTGKLYPPGWQGLGVLTPHRWEVAEEAALTSTTGALPSAQ